jgi:hypothetical protein
MEKFIRLDEHRRTFLLVTDPEILIAKQRRRSTPFLFHFQSKTPSDIFNHG